MPTWPTQHDMIAFYGNPAERNWLHNNTTDIACPWPLFEAGKPVAHILIHKKCADSLVRVLGNIWDAVGHDPEKIKQLRYDRFDGSYAFRPIRGGHDLSTHACAAALDFDADDNEQHSMKHLFQEDSLIVVKFKEEGAVWGGDWSPQSIDAMHFQFARVR